MSHPPAELFDEICRRHGHRCPMSTLGGRMGFAAMRRLECSDGDGLVAVCTMRTCALDGIRCATGCSEEGGSLAIVEQGRHALVLTNAGTGAGVEVELTAAAFALAGEYRRFREAVEERRQQLPASEFEALERERWVRLDGLLQQLRTAAEEELLICRLVVAGGRAGATRRSVNA